MKKIILLFGIIGMLFIPVRLWAQKRDYKFGKVTIEELSQKVYPKDSSADAAVLYNAGHVYYYFDNATSDSKGFQMEQEYKRRIKIYKREGFDEADFSIRLIRSGDYQDRIENLNAYTFNLVNGKIEKTKLGKDAIVKERINDSEMRIRIAMPNVKEGSVIDLEYNICSDFVWNVPNWYFQEDIPTVYSQYVVEIPEYFVFNSERKGYYKANYIKGEGKSNTIKSRTMDSFNDISYLSSQETYTMEDVPAFKEEPFLNSKYNYLSGEEYELRGTQFPFSFTHQYTTTWNDIAEGLLNSESFGRQLNSTGFYMDDLNGILANTKARTDAEKMMVVTALVKSKVKWNDHYAAFVDQPLRAVYKSGTGNSGEINLLLVSMLRSAGLTAYPIVLSTRSNGFMPKTRPSIDAINSVIAMVKIDSLSVLVDATIPASYPNALPIEYTNSFGRIIDKTKRGWIDLTPKYSSKERTYTQIDFDDKGHIQNTTVISRTGNLAEGYREINWNTEPQKISENLQKKEGISFINYSIANLKTNMGLPVIEKISVDLRGKGKVGDPVLYINPFVINRQSENPFKSKERTYPVDFGFPIEEIYTSKISIPQGYKPDGLPANEKVIVDGIALYEVNYTPSDDFVMVSSRLILPRTLIPGKRYVELKDLFSKMVQKENERIVLKKI